LFKIIFKLFKLIFIPVIGDWGLGIGDWGLGIGDWAQSPIPIKINEFLISFIMILILKIDNN
jgi:hypothetical protein